MGIDRSAPTNNMGKEMETRFTSHTPLSPEEVAIAEELAPTFQPRKAKHLMFYPRSPFQRLGYIAERIAQGCEPLPNDAERKAADRRVK